MTWILAAVLALGCMTPAQAGTTETAGASSARASGADGASPKVPAAAACPVVRSMEGGPTLDAHPDPTRPMAKAVGESTIVDYYHHFFSTPLASFRDLGRAEAHAQKTYTLGVLNPKSAYMSFATAHTPPDWDGDSETEWAYELTYWVESPERRWIAVNKTRVTWVDSASVVRFYVHDKDGLRPAEPLKRPWKMTDLTAADHSASFPAVLNDHPPVVVRLPEKGKWVEVHLAIHEYFEPAEVYATYDCLQIKSVPVYFSPVDGVLRRTKP